MGRWALKNTTTGHYNLALGTNAGYLLTSGSYNIYLGHSGVSTESSTLRLGSAQTRAFVAGVYGAAVAGVPVYVTSTGQLGKQSSSARFKQDIAPLAQRSEPLYQLRPVTFHYKHEPQGPTQYGLIAEEVAEVYPELVTRDADGQIDGVRYDALIPLLLNELQHQHHQASMQIQQLAELKAQNESLQAELKAQNEGLRAVVERLQGLEAQQQTARIVLAAQP